MNKLIKLEIKVRDNLIELANIEIYENNKISYEILKRIKLFNDILFYEDTIKYCDLIPELDGCDCELNVRGEKCEHIKHYNSVI